jgi:hypothetical protein
MWNPRQPNAEQLGSVTFKELDEFMWLEVAPLIGATDRHG